MAFRWIALLVCLVAAIAPTHVSACSLVVATPAESDTECGPEFTVGSEYLVFARRASVSTFRAITMGGTEPLSPDEDSEALKYVEAHYPGTDLSKQQAASSCSSTPGGDCLAALVLLACWLGVRPRSGAAAG